MKVLEKQTTQIMVWNDWNETMAIVIEFVDLTRTHFLELFKLKCGHQRALSEIITTDT